MKKINLRLLGILIVLLCLFSNQVVFADILIRKDGDVGIQPNVLSATTTFSLGTTTFSAFSAKSFIPVTANLIASDLIVDFNSTVGTAFVSIVDRSGNLVYSTVVDTFGTSELVIPIDGLNSGKYSVRISYGSTKLIGDFQL